MAALLLFISAAAYAQTFPKLTGRVVDQAGLLTPAQVVDIGSKSEALEQRTGRQFVVATVNSLEGRTIEDYGYRLGRAWGIGNEQKDDGVILLVAPKERKVRIETGYGARVFLTDAVSSVIIRESIVPRFKEGDFGGGITAGADRIIETMELPAAEAAKRAQEVGAQEAKRSDRSVNPFPVLFIVVIFFVIIGSIARRAGGRRYRRREGISPWVILWGLNELSRGSRGGWGGGGGGWGGGGGGGGFSGGGGSFGGGGASGGW
ncbi:TPM domain-containing protein [Sphingomonas sp. RB56-2]|uniref:TPM domain-containing protein n=1 Tax=Sphingomonas brevis TaxID=2908206 RepID=A0ABT0S8T9_9SPHN|nr:TPM domain-containing protein [Sphingomonas brevis]MCL6740807.1 TPM domain-containing protein [Sphingomonas brevis]